MAEGRTPRDRQGTGRRAGTGRGNVGSHRSAASSRRPAAATRRPPTGHAGTRRPASTRPMAVTRRSYKPVTRIPLAPSGRRLRVAMVALFLVVALFGARLVQVQGFDTEAYAAGANRQSLRLAVLPAQRGQITDRNGEVLAASEPAVDIFCDPTVIDGVRESEAYQKRANARRTAIAGVLARHLGGSQFDYYAALTRPDTQQSWIRRKVPAIVYRQIADELSDAGISGVYKVTAQVRSYPAGTLAGSVVGFVNGEGVGSAGLELTFDHLLRGTDGEESYDLGAYGRIPLGANVNVPATNGQSVQTTLDVDLQATLEVALQQAQRDAGAESAFGVVMNVTNGEVLALGSSPSYDPGRYGEYKQDTLGLKVVSDAYEPGSVQKVLTMAAALDVGTITPETQLDIPEKLPSGGDDITDLHEHSGHLNARGVLVESSNIGTAMIGRTLSREQYFDYMDRFGLGNRTGIELPGEGTGQVDYDMTEAQRDRAAFGQSLSVTGIQEAAAIAAVANGGVYNPPTIIKQVTDADGKVVPRNDDREPRRVISPEAAAMTVDMMENVVSDKNYKIIPIDNYRLFGKTGTAERYEPTCGCYQGYTTSFVGIGSVENPSLLVYIVVDKPTSGEPSGYLQAAPFVSDVMKVALPRYGVPLSTEPPRIEQKNW